MPVQDGIAVCKILRANPKTQRIPIIVLTGVLWPAHLREAMASGADDIVSKPVDLPDLLIRIRALFECQTIEEPAERFARYYEIIHEAASKSSDVQPPTGNE
jgi:CheY-like chemotaxis protein